MSRFAQLTVAAALAVCMSTGLRAASDTNADGSINFGNASQFRVLTWGDYSQLNNTFTGPSLVEGNLGIGGKGNFSMSDGTINGKLYMNTYGKFSKSGPAVITGGDPIYDNAPLNAGLMDGAALAMAAAGESSSSNSAYWVNTTSNHQTITTVNTGNSMTIGDSSAIGNPFGGQKIVLNLTDFVLTNGTFTLQGGAMTTYIINVNRNFSLNNTNVVLSGNLVPSHVLFNVTNQGGTGQVSINQGVNLYGNLVALGRKVSLSGGRIHGGRLLANQVAITSGGQCVSQ